MSDTAATSTQSVDMQPKRYRLLGSIRTTVAILGSAAIVLIALRNSLTWLVNSYADVYLETFSLST